MRPQLGRDKILKAAVHLFAKAGYHSTSVGQIALAASVSKGLMYNYFNSKDALLLAIVDDASQQMFALAEGLTDSDAAKPGSHAEVLRRFLDGLGANLRENGSQLSFQLSLLHQPDLKPIVEIPFRERGEKLLAMTTMMFVRAGAPDANLTARRFITEIDGIALHYLSIFADYPLDAMLENVFQNYKDMRSEPL